MLSCGFCAPRAHLATFGVYFATSHPPSVGDSKPPYQYVDTVLEL